MTEKKKPETLPNQKLTLVITADVTFDPGLSQKDLRSMVRELNSNAKGEEGNVLYDITNAVGTDNSPSVKNVKVTLS